VLGVAPLLLPAALVNLRPFALFRLLPVYLPDNLSEQEARKDFSNGQSMPNYR